MKNKVNEKPSTLESKKFLVETHLNEYSRLREEILTFLNQKSNSVNYALIVLAALITLLPTAVNTIGQYILLIATIPFLGLTWYIASIDSLIARVSQYLKEVLIPKVNELIRDETLEELGISREVQTVLDWERFSSSFAQGKLNNTVGIIITSGRNVLVFGPIPVLLGIFIYGTKMLHPRAWTSIEQILLWANLVIILGLAILGVLVRRQYKNRK